MSLQTSGRHALRRHRSSETTDAELREFELRAAQEYRQMIGADLSLTEAAKRAAEHSAKTPLALKKPW